MDPIDYFKDISEVTRYNNALLNEIRRTNTLLEQLVQLLQPKIGVSKVQKSDPEKG